MSAEASSSQASPSSLENTAGKRSWSSKGRLERLNEFPLDVLLYIFAHLHPLDLLRLARTTKGFRRILMSRRNTSTWKQARTRFGLPDGPDDLSEPAYANLAFSGHCHHCLKPHAMKTVLWEIRKRACKACFKKYYSPMGYDCIPYIPIVEVNFEGVNDFYYSKASKKHYQDKFRACYRAEDMTAFSQWQAKKRQQVDIRHQHANLCRTWYEGVLAQKLSDKHEMTAERYENVITRLELMGWAEELEKQRSGYNGGRLLFLRYHRLVWQPKPLTDRAQIVEAVQEQREIRIAEEAGLRYRTRHNIPSV